MIKNNSYSFITRWECAADPGNVLTCLQAVDTWPLWWPGFKNVTVRQQTPHRIVADMVVGIPVYSLAFTVEINQENPWEVQLAATGDLVGGGTIATAVEDDVVKVAITWNVTTTKKWMNVVAPVACPLFGLAHNLVMRSGGKALARQAGGALR